MVELHQDNEKEGTRLPRSDKKNETEKTTHRMGENTINHIYVKRLISKIYKFLQLNNKTNNPI